MRGSLLPGAELNTVVPPYLTLDDRLDYLARKNYLFGSVASAEDVEQMGRMNFHYFLGYARNYRMLAEQGAVPKDDALHHMLAIVDADRELAAIVFGALRQLEWRLRALFVEHHCSVFPSSGCYLDPKHYLVFDPTLPPVPDLLAKNISRSREPFVVEHLDRGQPAADLPVWAVVDTWSFSALSRVICEAGPGAALDGTEVRLWKSVAGSLGVAVPTVMEKLKAATGLRNLVAHHSRLWMRPSTDSRKIPTVFPKSLIRSIHPKSQYGVFLAVAEMLGPRQGEDGHAFLTKVDAVLETDPSFKCGITQVATRRRPTQQTPRTV